jgi:PAS domain S-box-containing protein
MPQGDSIGAERLERRSWDPRFSGDRMILDQRTEGGSRDAFEPIEAVMDLLPVGIMLVSGSRASEARIARYNTACARLLGAEPAMGAKPGEMPYAYYRADRSEPLPPAEWPSIRAIATGDVVHEHALHLRRPDGNWRVLSASAAPLRHDGRVEGAVVVYQDVTAQHALEYALRSSEERFQRLLATVPGVLYEYQVDREGRGGFSYLSPRCSDIFELEAQTIVSDIEVLRSMAASEDVSAIQEASRTASLDGTPHSAEVRIVTPSGREKWVQFLSLPCPPRPEAPLVRSGFILDVTERKRAEEALHEAEQWLNLTIEATGAGTLYAVPYGPAHISPRFMEMFGVRDPGAIKDFESFLTLLHPDDRERVRFEVEKALDPSGSGTYEIQYRCVCPDGRVRWIMNRGKVQFVEAAGARRAAKLVVVTLDITDRKREEEALRASEARYARLAATIPGVLYEFARDPDGTGRFTYISPRCSEMFEVDAPSVLADMGTHRRMIHPDDMRALERLSITASRSGRPFSAEARMTTPSGRQKWLQFTSLPSASTPGEPMMRSGVILDITERKLTEEALRESKDWLDLIVEASGAGTFHAVLPGPPTFSPRCREILGIPDAFAIGGFEDFLRLVHPDDQHAIRKSYERVLKGEGDVDDTQFRWVRPDGTVRCVASRMKARFADVRGTRRAVRIAGAFLDVTERRREEEAVREADRRKSQFLALLSHELRNPLAPIRNSLFLVKCAAPGSDQAARAMQVIERQTQHLTRLVDDLLDTTRISHGKIELHRKPLDLPKIVRQTCDDHRSLFVQRAVRLLLEEQRQVWVHADETRIAQVIGNLLQNALKFTPRGGTVCVVVGAEGGDAIVRVRDDGAGMDPEHVDTLFQPFAQADSSLAHPHGGLGLGLALARGLMELHGGSITGRSDGLGRGSEFTIRLPLGAPPIRGAAHPKPPPARHRGLVLLIEDNADAAQTMAEVLEVSGYEVRMALDGRTGIASARELTPDVILCDIGLPDVDGYEVARTLRGDDALRSTRFIALTGYAQPEDRARAMRAGFDAHLAKPAAIDELMDLIADRREVTRRGT